jgi:hypothetical protein
MFTAKEKETLKDFVVILAERMQQTKPGEWETINSKTIKVAADHKAYWINDNFGCATRVVKSKYHDSYLVQVQKSKKQPFAK